MKDINWWRSDEARDARTSLYVAHLLFTNAANKREIFSIKQHPEWPAVFYYDTAEDLAYWVECSVPIHAKDFSRGCHDDHMNNAARALIA